MSEQITEADGALWDYACDVDTALGERGAEPLTEDDLVREFRGIGHPPSHAAAMILAQRIGAKGRAERSATVEMPAPVFPPEATEPVGDGEVVQGASLAIPSADVQARHLICQEHQVYATFPQALCPYCVRAEQLLKRKGVTAIDKVRIDLEPARATEMTARTGRRTVPQIFIGETHVGGCDDLHDLDRQGGLDALLRGAVFQVFDEVLGVIGVTDGRRQRHHGARHGR